MKVIALNGSMRPNGNTSLLLCAVLKELEERHIETEEIALFDKTIHSCKGCFACRGKGCCVFEGDDFNACYQKLLESDGILLGSPVYSADVSGIMKLFLERAGVVASTNPHQLRHKAGASVAAVRRGGGLQAVDTMNHFFLNKEMLVVGSTYWNMVYGKDAGDVERDAEGMENMRNLGKNMAWVLQRITHQEMI